MKKIFICYISILLLLLTGCHSNEDFIHVITRESGSGTRDAFTELFKIVQEDEEGAKKDLTISEAEVTNSTAVVLQTVAEDKDAIGYMSMGSLQPEVKAIQIDSIPAATEMVKNGSYPITRPFNIVLNDKSKDNPLIQDYMSFLLSKTGQDIIEKEGYITNSNSTETYSKKNLEGKIIINGSSSVTPVMEALAEKYKEINPQIVVEVQQTDSTTGISSVEEEIADIGMSSRNLKDEELTKGLSPLTFAYDGLAIIVNNSNPINDLNQEQINKIYTGQINEWSELINGN